MHGSLFKSFSGDQIKREVDEELRFHLELLTQERLLEGVPLAEAKDAALTLFGDVEQVREQCVEISRRSHPAILALKSFLILIALCGVVVRVLGTDFHIGRVGGTLIAVGILGRLLVYLRSVTPSSACSRPATSSPLKLYEPPQASITVLDQKNRTPIERVIFDK